MLKHEDNPQPQTPSPSAAQVRVTPEELVAAVTALQIRKEGQPGTIAIGDAVEELGLDVTPEEVLAEVEAGRQAKPKKVRPRVWDRVVLALGLSGIALWVSFFVMPTYPFEDASALPLNVVAITGVPSTVSFNLIPHYVKVAPDLLVKDDSGEIVLFSEVKDNHPAECGYDYSSGSLEQFSSTSADFPFDLVKHSGQIYLRGGMLRMSEQALQKNGADITWDIESRVPVTLPLNGFQVVPGMGDENSGFHAVNIHLDKHAYEKW